MAGAESIEREEVGCGCGGVGLSLLWLVAGAWTGCLLLLLLPPRRKDVEQTFFDA